MRQCDRCGTLILDFGYETVHMMVKEGDTPDKVFIWCDECYQERE